ncbi:MAG: arginine--tRNA ligase [Syntrophobacterales bacterium]|jgi:arginyl-tRNA synthetase|nr:arginine--tRNA ligase [Syntrophobacterales bacterium]
MLRQKIAVIIEGSIARCMEEGTVPHGLAINPVIDIPREEQFGDYSSNIAFFLAPKVRKSPLEIARMLIGGMVFDDVCDKVEVAGKGFINFYVRDDAWRRALRNTYEAGIASLYPNVGGGKKVLIEFVSSNPTGPLHIGHGRGAAVGDVLSNMLKRTGYEVVKEYYVNDAGKQIRTLGESTYLRWKELKGESVEFAENLYQGEYVKDIAALIVKKGLDVPEDRDEAVRFMASFASEEVLMVIESDLEAFGVKFDNYFRETSLYRRGMVESTLDLLKKKDYAYEKDDALWFRTSSFEKDEDRVLIKSDGEKTYFASDIAYHQDKLQRQFDMLVDIWGSDHHGYIPRMRASLQALGLNKEALKFLLIQFVTLLKNGKPVGMSTRSGEFTTLREVLDEVGKDAARFFFLMRKCDAHLEFDLDLAKKTSNENPVYYVQYAHARIESIFRVAAEGGIALELVKDADVSLLQMKEEISLIKMILQYYSVLEGGATSFEPHRVTFYLLNLVAKFHSYYNKARVLGVDPDLTLARLLLLKMLKKTIKDGLDILGVSSPERM